jgi:hypothetical protein
MIMGSSAYSTLGGRYLLIVVFGVVFGYVSCRQVRASMSCDRR